MFSPPTLSVAPPLPPLPPPPSPPSLSLLLFSSLVVYFVFSTLVIGSKTLTLPSIFANPSTSHMFESRPYTPLNCFRTFVYKGLLPDSSERQSRTADCTEKDQVAMHINASESKSEDGQFIFALILSLHFCSIVPSIFLIRTLHQICWFSPTPGSVLSDGKLDIVVPSFVHYLEVLEGSDRDKMPGYKAPNLRKLEDKVAAEGFLVEVPDFFYGEPFDLNNPNMDRELWRKAHGVDKGFEVAKLVISTLRSKGVTSIGVVGFC